jgi:hypothetical protein
MNRRSCVGIVVVALACAELALGCNTVKQPSIVSAGIVPPQLSPGFQRALVTVDVNDPFKIVTRVEGVVREDTNITLRLVNDGTQGDVKADDDIWSLEVDVPFDAPPGDFHVNVVAYDSDGEQVLVQDSNGDIVPLTAEFALVIDIPPAPTDEVR